MNWNERIFDAHAHIKINSTNPDTIISDMLDYLSFVNLEGMNILILKQGINNIGYDALSLYAKLLYPQKFQVYDGFCINNPAIPFNEKEVLRQAKAMVKAGFGGLKLLFFLSDAAQKNSEDLGYPNYIDDPRMDAAFDYLEESRFPVMLHMGLPMHRVYPRGPMAETCLERLKKLDLPVNDRNITIRMHMKERLKRNPKLKVIMAHTYFMAGQQELLQEFLDEFPDASIDICPANGVYTDLCANPEKTRDFFIKYQDRILFGTDNVPQKLGGLDQVMNIRRFLETNHTFFTQVNNGYDSGFWGHMVTGIELPDNILKKIYFDNWKNNYASVGTVSPKSVLEYALSEKESLEQSAKTGITEHGKKCLCEVIRRME